MLKFREAPLVVESLASLEKAVPSPKEEDEPDAGRKQNIVPVTVARMIGSDVIIKHEEECFIRISKHREVG